VPLRRRLALTVALVALAVVVASGSAAWLTTRSVLRGNVDDALRAQARAAASGPGARIGRRVQGFVPSPGDTGGTVRLRVPPPREGGPAEYAQVLTAGGATALRGDVALPVSAADRTATAAGLTVGPRDVEVDGAHLRMITVPVSTIARLRYAQAGLDIGAMQFARPMAGVDQALRTLWIVLLLVGLVVVTTAALLGRAAARRVLRPVTDLADAAGHVEATADLDRRLAVGTQDEVGELTRRFNGMLSRLQRSRAELDRSMEEQRNLVADASHELRTPVTSLRTNAEVLLEDDDTLSPDERRGILADVRDQAEDLGLLVTDLIELARGDAPDRGADEPVALDALVAECVGRARRDHRGVRFTDELEHVVVAGRPDRLARAVQNLVNNAALHGAGGAGDVEVRVATATAPDDDARGRGSAGDGTAATGHDDETGHDDAPDRDVALWSRGPGPPAPGATPSEAVITVVDHGPGVPEADRARIFDRFRRGDTARGRHGSGLGLAIVRQVATVHGGTVAVRETPGGGATFVLRLPLADT
jgi:two-component system sensor histidine kinase MprB